jgi:hypothetical protein
MVVQVEAVGIIVYRDCFRLCLLVVLWLLAPVVLWELSMLVIQLLLPMGAMAVTHLSTVLLVVPLVAKVVSASKRTL